MAAVQHRLRSGSDPFSDQHRQQSMRDPVQDAVRDTVQLRGSSDRARANRTQTSNLPPASVRPQHASRRSQSQDSVLAAAAAVEKARITNNAQNRKGPKKGSSHADVIDRLDFTGVGPMFHHDGPFDACAPSRNRHKNKAPMLAWTAENVNQHSQNQVAPPSTRDIQFAQHTANDGPYPRPSHLGHSYSYSAPIPENSRRKVDLIAEAWGLHEPEPFEDFSAGGGYSRTPASSIRNGQEGHARPTRRETQNPPVRGRTKRTVIPPPQPIFTDEGAATDPTPVSPPLSSGAGVRRNKSLMQRIRKMRDNPNVPAEETVYATGDEILYGSPQRPGASRAPTSYKTRQRDGTTRSPSSEGSDHFVHVDTARAIQIDQRREKELPITPGTGGSTSAAADTSMGYFDEYSTSPPNAGGLGRKTSLLKKVRDAVRGK